MRRSQMELLMVGVAVLALAAGVAVGLLAAKLPAVLGKTDLGTPPRLDQAPLTEALSLTGDQREKVRAIWEGVRGDVRETYEQARALERRRDEAYIALLTTEQKAQYERISQDLAIQFDSLSHRRDELFERAVDATKKLLNDSQRSKYEEILRARGPGGSASPRGEGKAAAPRVGLVPKIDGEAAPSHGRNNGSGPS